MTKKQSKLTIKQATIISIIISAIYFIFTFMSGIEQKPIGEFVYAYWGIGCFGGTMLSFIFFYFLIFKVDERKIEAEEKEIENAIIKSLSYVDFKEVYFISNEIGSKMIMMSQILKNEGCRFYIRLTEDNNIYLIVKDKHEEEVYSTEIMNFVYFISNFKFEK